MSVSKHLFPTALICTLGVLLVAAPCLATTVSLTPARTVVSAGDVISFEILVDVDEPLGSFSVGLDCDPERFAIENVRSGTTPEFSGAVFTNISGCSGRISGFQIRSLNSPTGLVNVARFDLRVAATALPTAAALVQLTARSLSNTLGVPIPALSQSATVTIGPVCGDGVLNPDEDCDPGLVLWAPGTACNDRCAHLSCGDPDDSGRLTATDSLFTLRAVVGLAVCELCVCDVNNSGGPLTASDALVSLRASTGGGVVECPACP